MHSVTILLSTYNGEKYLEKQLNCLLTQIDIKVNILVRDDGSVDSTLDILREFSDKYDNLNYYIGNNLGPAWSFVDLIKNSPESEYYAFCDQDDVWKDDKVRIGVSMLEGLENDQPNMYYSNLFVTDESLNNVRKFLPDNYKKESKYNVIIDNMAAGCTIIFNHKVKEFINRLQTEEQFYILMHDAWVHLICSFFGTVVYDSNAYIYYRQHGDNTIGTSENKSIIRIIREKIDRFFDVTVEPRRMLATNFYKTYGDLLSKEDADKIKLIVDYKSSWKSRIKLLCDREIVAPTFKRDIRYRILILRGLA